MRRRDLLIAGGVLAAGAARAQTSAPATPGKAPAGTDVDVLLVIAVDVSRSVTEEEALLQREGYRGAMTDPDVLTLIAGGPLGAIGVVYFEWARYDYQTVVVPWTRVATAADAQAWADRLEQSPRQSMSWTSLSGALAFAGTQLAAAPFVGTRRVVDVSGDGANNNGPPAEGERDRLVASGVTINGLPIINRHPRFGRLELDVDKYYKASVVGGPGAFMIVADDFTSFAEAVRRKLRQEIAGNADPRGDGVRRAG